MNQPFWVNDGGQNPDVVIINAVRPGLSKIPYSLLLLASSPYSRRGVLYSNFAKYFGQEDAPVLVWKGTTPEMNSNLVDDPLIAEMVAEDYERAQAEFFAEFRTDITEFISREAVEAVMAHGIRELPPSSGLTYRAFTDPSGGSADSFTWAIGHIEPDGRAILDAMRERKPPFSPDAVVEEYAALLKSYGNRSSPGRRLRRWPRERFSVHGIQYDVSEKNKSQIYLELLPALNGRRVQLLDLPRLTGQFFGLERRTARGGPGLDPVIAALVSLADVKVTRCGSESRRLAPMRLSRNTRRDAPKFWMCGTEAAAEKWIEVQAALRGFPKYTVLRGAEAADWRAFSAPPEGLASPR